MKESSVCFRFQYLLVFVPTGCFIALPGPSDSFCFGVVWGRLYALVYSRLLPLVWEEDGFCCSAAIIFMSLLIIPR